MKDVYFVVLPKLVLLDVAGPAEAFRIAERRVPGSYRLHFVAPSESIECSIGLRLAALEPLPDTLGDDAIVVLTGVSGKTVDLAEPATVSVIQWLRSGVVADSSLVSMALT